MAPIPIGSTFLFCTDGATFQGREISMLEVEVSCFQKPTNCGLMGDETEKDCIDSPSKSVLAC